MDASKRLTQSVIDKFRAAVAEAGGNEVFAVGKIDEDGIVAEITIAASGTDSSVPALEPFMERGDVLIHNHPSGPLTPSEADMSIASREGNRGVGFYIVDNEVARLNVVVESIRKKPIKKLDADKLASIIDSGGALSKRIDDYEARPTQVSMLKEVVAAFNGDRISICEAGTGVGKSLAYLIPAFEWARVNEERVIVSTGTINLQEQLVDKDIPLAQSLLKSKVKAMLVKGRANYLCRNRLAELVAEENLLAEDSESELGKLVAWAETSKDGSKSDLSFKPADGLWSQVCSEGETCMGLHCGHRDNCFLLRMRREAADCQVLVVNHHLLFADLSARASGIGMESTAVLPPFQRIVFDEAHAIESAATSFFSRELNRFAIGKLAGRLQRFKSHNRAIGILPQLQRMAKNGKQILGKASELVQSLRAQADAVDMAAMDLLDGKFNARLTKESPDSLTNLLLIPLTELAKKALGLAELIQDALDDLDPDASEELVVYEARMVLRRLADIASLCHDFRGFADADENVYWIDKLRLQSGDSATELIITPLDLGPLMRESLFEVYKTIVCTSATLTVGSGFGYFMARVGMLGLEEREISAKVFASPFPYHSRVLLGIPTDAPLPEEDGYADFLIEAIRKLLVASQGHALVLFTSYESLRRVYEAVKPDLEAIGITSFRQGDDERSKLLEAFKCDVASVLFATDSFWEGVDAPGDTLRVVIMARLPFRVPTEPIQLARAEAIEAAGGNPFMELSLPEAVMKFKQGFGRLMRKSSDSGSVIVLDSRVVKKRYGRIFLESLPETKMSMRELSGVARDLENFLYN